MQRIRLFAVAIGALLCIPAQSDPLRSKDGSDLWTLTVGDNGMSRGRAKIPGSSPLAKLLDRCCETPGELPNPVDDQEAISVESRNAKLRLSPTKVLIGRNNSTSPEWKLTTRSANDRDEDLRLQLLRVPRFEDAEVVQVSQFMGRQGDLVEFDSTMAPGFEIPEHKRRFQLPEAMLEGATLEAGRKYVLLRLRISERRYHFQVFDFNHRIKTLVETAPPISRFLSEEPAERLKDVAQLKHYFGHLGDSDLLIAGVSGLTISGMTSETLLRAAPELAQGELRRLVQDSRWNLNVRSAFATMLAHYDQREDAPVIRSLLDQAVSAPFDNVGANRFAVAYMLIVGDEAIDQFEQNGLEGGRDSWKWNELLRRTLLTISRMPSKVSRERVLRTLRARLDGSDPEFAISDLAQWKDWESIDRIASLAKSSGRGTRRTVLRYLLACLADSMSDQAVRDKAQRLMESIRAKDPDILKGLENP